jgi:hypothetical protein
VVDENGVLLHFCVECGRSGPFGFGVSLRRGQLGRWYCRDHRPNKKTRPQKLAGNYQRNARHERLYVPTTSQAFATEISLSNEGE